MALTGTTPLEMIVGVQGVSAAVGQLRTLAGGVDTVGVAAKRSFGSMVGLPRGVLGSFRSVAGGIGGMFGGLRGMLAPLGMALGGAGLVRMVKGAAEFSQKLTSWQLELGKSASWADTVRGKLGELAVTAGRPREELLAAAMAMQDLGMNADEAIDSIADASNFARLLDVNLEQAGPALAAMAKLAPDMDPMQRMAMLRTGAGASGMKEEAFLGVVAKLGPMIASLPGMKGQQGAAFLGRIVAARGEEFASDPGRAVKMIRSFTDGLGSQEKKVKDALRDLGINTSDLNQAFPRLMDAAMGGERAFDKLPAPMKEFIWDTIRSDGAIQRSADTYSAMAGDMTAAGQETAAALAAIAATNPGSIWETIKSPFINLGDDIAKWASKHQKQIVAAIQAVIGALGQFGGALVTAWSWVKDNIGEPVADFFVGTGTGKNATVENQAAIDEQLKDQEVDIANQVTNPRLNPALAQEHTQIKLNEATGRVPAGTAAEWEQRHGWNQNRPPAASPGGGPVGAVVQVYVDSRVDAEATVRTTQNATAATRGVSGAP